MRSRRVLVVVTAALAVVALTAVAVIAATPKDGKFTGETDTGKKISIKVSGDGDEAKVSYCGYKMPSGINNGKFNAKHNGAGGTYVAVKGSFPTKKTAKGVITVDFLCDTEGEKFTAKQ